MEHEPSKVAGLRLRRHADYQLVYSAAKKQHSRQMSFFMRLRPTGAPEGQPRVGLTVGKVLGKAHERNRIKRRLRAAVRLHASILQDIPVDVVLHPRRTVLDLEWPLIEREIAQVFRTVRKLAARTAAEVPAPNIAPARSPGAAAAELSAASLRRPGGASA